MSVQGLVCLTALCSLALCVSHAALSSKGKQSYDGQRVHVYRSFKSFDVVRAGDPLDSAGSCEDTAANATYCYSTVCCCYKDVADCSFSDLTFIPTFNESVLYLNFTYNRLSEITGPHFFDNVTHIEGLDLADNGLNHIAKGSFDGFKNLKYLNLAYNSLTYGIMETVLSIQTLHYLDVVTCGLGKMPDDLFEGFHLPFLQTLLMHNNSLRRLNMTAFSYLPALRQLGVAENGIYQLQHAHMLPNLTRLNLDDNALYEFPRTCNYTHPLFPNLKRLTLRNNRISRFLDRTCLRALEWLDLSGNVFPILKRDMFYYRIPKLYHVSLEAMGTNIKYIQPYAFRHRTLQSISLMYNNLAFSNENIDPKSFAGCPNLTDLQLSHNEIRHHSFRRIFGNITTLRRLFMGHCGFTMITPDTFDGLVNLENLTLYRNELTSLPDGAFDKLPKLRVLDLSNNLIRIIRETTFSSETRGRLYHLDLSTNKFHCSCELEWFRRWLILKPYLFSASWSDYNCDNVPNTTVVSFHVVEQTCLLTSDENRFISATIGLLIVILTATALIFRYRWQLRLVLYDAFRGRGDRLRRLQALNFQFDVYVSYANEDLNWVRMYLMPELEDKMGLKLCIHERDFILGYPIVDNISDSVEASKKVMMIFSKHFTRSQWCQFELYFCLDHVLKNDDALLVVCLEDLTSRDLTTAMMAVLNTNSYIQWDEDSDAVRSFWGRIRIALNEVIALQRF